MSLCTPCWLTVHSRCLRKNCRCAGRLHQLGVAKCTLEEGALGDGIPNEDRCRLVLTTPGHICRTRDGLPVEARAGSVCFDEGMAQLRDLSEHHEWLDAMKDDDMEVAQ